MHHAIASVLICSMCLGTAVSAATSDIDLITTEDELGYACISAANFVETDESPAMAFLIGGKLRLPRTCVDDPCQAALTQRELSQLTGTDPRIPRFVGEWNDYYARYADYCRKETTPDGGAVAETDEDFWDRTRRPAQSAQSISAGSPVLPQTIGTAQSPNFLSGITPISFNPITSINNYPEPDLFNAVSTQEDTGTEQRVGDPDSGEVLSSSETASVAPTVVPISSTLLLMVTSLLALGVINRFRRT